MAARVNVPREASEFTELCKLEAPQNAVKCSIKAKPTTRTFFHIRHCSLEEFSGEKSSSSSVLTL